MPLNRRTKILLFLLLAGVATLSTLLARSTPDTPHKALLSAPQVSPQVAATLERACQNCHSENTAWPWYSNVPPVSWKVHGDVERARRFMNLSKWDDYTDLQKRGFRTSIALAIETRAMPPSGYLLLHPEARLSEGDRKALENWGRVQRH